MVAVFSGLLVAIGVFMLAFFPARMSAQAQDSTVARAASIAQIMASALGPALEFDDPDHAATILAWLAQTPDANFGVVRGGDGALLAAWRPDAIPANLPFPTTRSTQLTHNLLVVTAPIDARGGAHGTLHIGYSLRSLAAERDATRRTVGLATAIVLTAGVLATLLLAALVVRPIRRLTHTALRISRGELPPELPSVTGGDEVARMADALHAMLARVHEVSQQELMRASRHAGMAEVATGVLHNVGNVLTSVNVSVELLRERTEALPLARMRRLNELLAAALAAGRLDSQRLTEAVRYVALFTDALDQARTASLADIATLRNNVDHMKRVVAMQNAYTRHGGVVEPTRITGLIDEAIALGCPPARRGDIEIAVHAPSETVLIDRHRVLQIVVNLMTNARDAVNAARGTRRITVRVEVAEPSVKFSVVDTGIGIAPDVLDRIFHAGFTTKATGHGYGLHSAVLAARQLGGDLTASSEGPDRGATFTLEVPVGDRPRADEGASDAD